ncbi:H-type small acid-soluble spore protein [Mesobacillus maritimus]|uniref:small, acid-soluble spore protein, H family n=1 Tax=Mesobacillus maritimus TaxID=1643336 RepID=UPI00203E990E|nr:small, acid-soluble spore protein, H family [Mesobacillus maritimus]MCM3669184.1 H-type small acid-soluble spore protein [Mesobacillus maritimus]
MNVNRLKEIVASKDEILLHYHGIPIWIDSIDESSGLAKGSERGAHDTSRLIPIDEIEE